MSNELVAYSRAGDIFHYRWAARRCLHLIYPNSTLQSIVVEGSSETSKDGEYVIDVTEYYVIDTEQRIVYYQLKHSTVQVDDAFTISDLKGTFDGFSKRFVQHCGTGLLPNDVTSIRFVILTNRVIRADFIQNIKHIAAGKTVDKSFKKTIEKYTALTGDSLKGFCGMLEFQEVKENYLGQKEQLKVEIAQLIAGSVDSPQIDSIVALVQDKVLPDANHKIVKEEILQKFGITFERELYPAPPVWEKDTRVIPREQHEALKKQILELAGPFIVHAGGGVGKSVFSRYLTEDMEEGSLAIAFDCFGAGGYRNRSSFRHGHKNALVQIANELASRGLCSPLLPSGNDADENIMRAFLHRVEASLVALKKTTPSAKLVVIVDAADNAEMAAIEFNQTCFAHEVLREHYPEDFRLVLLCRTERIELLQPMTDVVKLSLLPFSDEESFANLQKRFPDATQMDGKEFHRLTSGNPRVQANALDRKSETAADMLTILGPAAVTVEELIKQQLQIAVNRMKDALPSQFGNHIQAIGTGLASLPPHIPLPVLAAAAEVDIELIKSFIADIGRSLWLSDDSVQFRDEPTETWFRETFSNSTAGYKIYLQRLERLAEDSTYVAEALPMLYLQAEAYAKLIEIALSDAYLPKHNPIEERNVRVYRLKFAFQAALKQRNFSDAIKLAVRAGEEVAGDQRQLRLLQDNIDLLATLQNHDKVQQMAYRRSFSGNWPGAENIYSASALSFVPAFKGEARGYIRSAQNWLAIYFNELKDRQKTPQPFHERVENNVQNEDILELAFAILNVNGCEACFDFLHSLRPKQLIARIFAKIADRLLDHGKYEEITKFLESSARTPEFYVAITETLMDAGRFSGPENMEVVLSLLANKKTRIKTKDDHFYQNSPSTSIVCFLEVCLRHNLPKEPILRVLRHYVPQQISIGKVNLHNATLRTNFLKSLAIRKALDPSFKIDTDVLLPDKNTANNKSQRQKDEFTEFKEVILGLFPWFDLRARVIAGTVTDLLSDAQSAAKASSGATSSRYRSNDFMPGELVALRIAVLGLCHSASESDVCLFYDSHIKNAKDFNINQVLDFARIVFRCEHLRPLRTLTERRAADYIKLISDDGPEQISSRYIRLARAVVVSSTDDASVYFDEAIKIVSKFGDEITSRWDAVVSLAKHAAEFNSSQHEAAHRFIRCAEVVGNNLREKHWDRDQALQICLRLSPAVGMAALSRWRDRQIGYFDYLLKSALSELMKSGRVSAGLSWGLRKLQSIGLDIDEVALHLDHPGNEQDIKQLILDDAVLIFGKQGYLGHYILELDKLALKHGLPLSEEVQQIIADAKACIKLTLKKSGTDTKNDNAINWESIFVDVDLTTAEGLQTAYERFRKNYQSSAHYLLELFWKQAFALCKEQDLLKIVDAFLSTSFIYYSDIPVFFKAFPDSWQGKVSFKKKWPEIVRRIGEQCAYQLHTPYIFRSFCREMKITDDEIVGLKEGVFSRFEQATDLEDAEVFFNFASLACSFIPDADAMPLLDYSVGRFELHIEKDFGDGQWDNWLHPSGDMAHQIAGLLWSALGSPWAATRWQAAHALAWLPAAGGQMVFQRLLDWMKQGTAEQFGSKDFIFYNLHARLYLLIGCSKIAAIRPDFLVGYKAAFIPFALERHALIQKISAQIIQALESYEPGTYDAQTLCQVQKAVLSPFAIQSASYNYQTDSYWHGTHEEAVDAEFSFGIDFPQYWYGPLGRVFGVSQSQVCDLARLVIADEWHVADLNGYRSDPRMALWNSSSEQRATWHDHGSYPTADSLDFYHSYHAMFVVAADLLRYMPVILRHGYEEDKWTDWLTRHALTFDDGQWIADYRDRVPVNRPQWVGQPKEKNWKTKIKRLNLLDILITDEKNEKWLYIDGNWHEIADYQKEICRISTALVSRTTSRALLNALSTYKDPMDYKLPNYQEEDHEFDDGKFVLKGWLHTRELNKGIDKLDPEASGIAIPPAQPGEYFRDELGLQSHDDGRTWVRLDNNEPVIRSEVYSSLKGSYSDDEPGQSGDRVKASLSFLLHICDSLKLDIIFEVGVTRDFAYRSSSTREEERTEKYKVFLLTSDGTIRDTGKSYKLR